MSNGEGLRSVLRRVVGIVLLGVWCFPAAGLTAPLAPRTPAASTPADVAARASSSTSPASEAAALAARERQAPDLQDFKGGGVSIYIGSGVLLVLVVVLVLVLII